MKEALMLLTLHPFILCGCCYYKKNECLNIKDPNLHVEMVVAKSIPETSIVKVSSKKIAQKLAPKKKDWKTTAVSKVKYFEGFSHTPYICEAGEKTIGYGFTGALTNRKWIDKPEANKILDKELAKAQADVKKYVHVKLSNSQLWSLTSFTYNCGAGNLKKLVTGPGRLNAGNYNSVPKLLPQYAKGNGKFLKGLLIRRNWESSLWKEKA